MRVVGSVRTLAVMLVAAVTAACAGPAAAGAVAPRLRLRWLVEPEALHGSVVLAADGGGEVAVDGAATRRLSPSPARAAAARRFAARAAELPRWLYSAATFAGARLWIELDGREVHDAAHEVVPAVEELLTTLAASDGVLRAVLTPLRAASPPANGPRLAFSPGDDPAPIGAILASRADAPLRHLCARIVIAEGASALVPSLRQAFERQRATDGEGDYFTASALLRLGDPVGLSRVAAVRQSSRPDWREEACADLEACLPAAAVLPRCGDDDDGAAAAAHLLQWWDRHGAELRFDAATGRYTSRAGDG